MTTIDLLQRYPPHKDFTQHDEAPDTLKAFNGKKPDRTMPNPDSTQYFDAKTKLLNDMLDRVVKDLANSQSEPASEWEGTLWRPPLRPRSRSPAYSEISESFESPGRIEYCTDNLLSTPISPTSAQFKGPDGWPIGIEVAMNDFHRGRLSTSVLQEKELPNPLILRSQKQRTPRFGGNGNRGGQETASCESVPSEQHGDGQHQQEREGLKPLAFQEQQSNRLLQQYGERQDHLDSVSLKPLAALQQSFTRPQQPSDRQYRQESVDLDHAEMQQQSDEENHLTLSARKYSDKQNSLGNASSEFYPALAHGKLPIGLGFENASLELSTFHFHGEEHDGFYAQIDGTSLLYKDSPQTALSNSPPRYKVTHEDAHQAELRIHVLPDALYENPDSSKALSPSENIGVGSIDREIGCQNTFEDSENDTLQGIGLVTSEDSEADTDSNIVFWKTSGPLEDILEEDPLTSIFTLDQDQPQHFAPGSAEHLDLPKNFRAGERRDSMLALHRPQTEPSSLSLSSPRVLPTLKLTISPSSKPQFESTKPSRHRPIDVKSSESILSATTMAELKDATRGKGRLCAGSLAEMRKTAESQPHFQTGSDSPKDQSQADIHPLLRSKSFFRPSYQPSRIFNDTSLRYVFEDDDSESHEAEVGDSSSHQITIQHRSLFQPEAQDAESVVTQISTKEHQLPQLGKVTDDTVPRYTCNDDDTEGHEAEHGGTFTSHWSTLRSSNDTTLVPSLKTASCLPSTSPSPTSHLSASADGSPDVMPSSILQPSISPSTTGYYLNSAIGSPAAYNSWASTPQFPGRGNSSSTPSSAATLPTSTIPTPNASFNSSSSTSRGMTMTPSSSFGQSVDNVPNSGGITMTPSSSFSDFTGNRNYRRSVSVSSMFARYHKARCPDLPTAAMTDSILSSKESAERANDPFTSTCDTSTPFSFNLKTPSKEDLAVTLNTGVDQFHTPTKRTPGRFSLHRRSLSTSGRPNPNEGIERALSTMVFIPQRSRLHKRSNSISTSIDTTVRPDDSGLGHRRSLSIATTVEQKWEIAPPPTPLGLRDEFSMRYRPEPHEANNHYSPRKDALQGIKHGLKKVFGRK